MKLICIEEHALDGALAAVTQGAEAAEAPYRADLAGKGAPPADGADRPQLVLGGDIKAALGDLGAGRIAQMDRHGIDMQILSYSNSPQLAPIAQAADLVRAANDRLAQACQANPARFAGFATLPWQDTDAACAELERTVRDLGLKGVMLIGRPGDAFLDDPRYDPILATLNALKAPLYVHPGAPLPQVREPYYGALNKVVSARLSLFGWGWHNEAGVQVVRMLLSGVFDRHRDLRVISGHWGEMVPFYLQRLDDALPVGETGLSRSVTQTYREQVYVTPSGMLNLPHFRFIHGVLGADRIIYSVDYPYATLDGARAFLDALPVSAEDREKIACGNATRLFGL